MVLNMPSTVLNNPEAYKASTEIESVCDLFTLQKNNVNVLYSETYSPPPPLPVPEWESALIFKYMLI